MKVILLQDVKGVGKAEQIIEASDGYAFNFLFPKNLAMEATKQNIAKLESKRKNEEAKRVKEVEAARALKERLEALPPVKILVKTGGAGKMYGSITNKEIAEALVLAGVEMDKRKIVVNEPIKTLGEKTVSVKLFTDITAKLKIELVDS